MSKEYTLEDFAVALISRLPLKEQREEVLEHLTGENLEKARVIHEEANRLEDFDVEEAREYLNDITELEGSEVGRELSLILDLYDETGSEEFQQHLKREIYLDYWYFKNNFEIVEEEYTPPSRIIKKLIEKR